MKKIGVISDTHGYIDDKLIGFFSECDEIWHAGDVGDYSVIDRLSEISEVKVVFGNIDGTDIRSDFKENLKFQCENMNVWITHIGGYPGKYDFRIRNELMTNPPDIFVAGHSHILKIIYDNKINCLHINPGAYGKSGIHKVRTALKFEIDKEEVRNMKILEIER